MRLATRSRPASSRAAPTSACSGGASHSRTNAPLRGSISSMSQPEAAECAGRRPRARGPARWLSDRLTGAGRASSQTPGAPSAAASTSTRYGATPSHAAAAALPHHRPGASRSAPRDRQTASWTARSRAPSQSSPSGTSAAAHTTCAARAHALNRAIPRSIASIRYGRSADGIDDPVHGPHLDGALDAVDRVEPVGELAELLGAHRRPAVALRSARRRRRSGPVGRGEPLVERRRSAGRPASPASTSRAKTTAAAGAPPITEACAPSQRDDLEVLVEALGEHDERPAVVARDHAEDDRAVEVHDRSPDLGAELQLPFAHRLRRAVEAREVREDDERPAAGRRC